jgi:preprotein translocase subunit SecG
MIAAITVLHILACIALVLIVLLQAGKGAEMGAAFGGASQTLFGSAGAMGFLSKLTIGAAVVFMCTCLVLAFASTRRVSSVVRERPAQTAPAAPDKSPVQPSAPAQPQAPAQPAAPAQPQAPVPVPKK